MEKNKQVIDRWGLRFGEDKVLLTSIMHVKVSECDSFGSDHAHKVACSVNVTDFDHACKLCVCKL